MSDTNIKAVIAAVRATPGWEATEYDNRYRVTGPGGALVYAPNRAIGRGLDNLIAQLRRAGWEAPATQPASRRTRPRSMTGPRRPSPTSTSSS